MFASLRNHFSNYRTSSLRFDIEKNIIIEAFDRFASLRYPCLGLASPIFSNFAADHGLINYIETKAKGYHLKKIYL